MLNDCWVVFERHPPLPVAVGIVDGQLLGAGACYASFHESNHVSDQIIAALWVCKRIQFCGWQRISFQGTKKECTLRTAVHTTLEEADFVAAVMLHFQVGLKKFRGVNRQAQRNPEAYSNRTCLHF